MKRIRVLLARMPPLMLDILHHVVTAEPDMAVVGVIDEIDLTAAVRRARADVVVVGEDPQGEQHDLYLNLLHRHPHIKVLAIAESGKRASFYELRPRRISIGKISARSFATAIRARTPLNPAPASVRKKPGEVH